MSKRPTPRERLDELDDEGADDVSKKNGRVRRVDPPQGGILLVRNGGGRPAGQPNKLPRAIKDAIREAMELHGEDGAGSMGMTGYMLNLLKRRPELFVSLVRRTLPVQLRAELDANSLMAKLLQTAAAARDARNGSTLNGNGSTNGILDITPLRRSYTFDDDN